MLAKLRIEMKDGKFMLSKVTDINTGLVIPVRSIKIDAGVDNWKDGILATIVVPIEELELDGVLTKIETWEEDKAA
jgi:hypothetical protein